MGVGECIQGALGTLVGVCPQKMGSVLPTSRSRSRAYYNTEPCSGFAWVMSDEVIIGCYCACYSVRARHCKSLGFFCIAEAVILIHWSLVHRASSNLPLWHVASSSMLSPSG